MRLFKILAVLLVLFALATSALGQTDPQGRQHALQMYEAYRSATQSGDHSQFEAMFSRDPQLTKRAFVSTMEYATEVYQSDMNSASQAVGFAGQLADLIAQQFGDQAPSALLRRMLGQDPSAMGEFYRYACSVFPGYANGGGNPSPQPGMPGGYSQQPGYPSNAGMPGGYPQQPGYPGGMPGGYPQQPGYPGGMPGGYPQQPGYPGGMPGGYPQQPGYPQPQAYPGGYPQQQAYPSNSGPFRPSSATGGPGGG